MDKTVLVVDDEPMARDLLRIMLKRDGYTVLEAVNGEDGLNKIAESAPDLVILDVMMPVMDGLTACKAIRSNPGTADLPVIMLSARSHTQAVQEGMEAGADLYLSKLTSRKDLVMHIKTMLEKTAHSESP